MNPPADKSAFNPKDAIIRLDTRAIEKKPKISDALHKQVSLLSRWLESHQPAGRPPAQGRRSYCALFNGPSGTGKTLAAMQLAHESELPLYRVALSKVISSYIGETEKNLDALFKQADRQDWILFFDEADALFGKRSEVKDAHDRYANQEVSYLLQRLETHPGLAILSSDLDEPIDDKFLRHFQAVLQFR